MGHAGGLPGGPPSRSVRGRGAADPVPGRGTALHADAAGRLAQRAARRARAAEGPARIQPQARVPPQGRTRDRIRVGAMRTPPEDQPVGAIAPAERVTIYTDGACSGNPGPGGWGALLTVGGGPRNSQAASP